MKKKSKHKPIVLILLATVLLFCTVSSIVLLIKVFGEQDNASAFDIQTTYYIFSIVTATLSVILVAINIWLFKQINERMIKLNKNAQTGRLQVISEFSVGRIGYKIECHGMGSVQIESVRFTHPNVEGFKTSVIDLLDEIIATEIENMYFTDNLVNRCISAGGGFFLFKYSGKNVFIMKTLNEMMSQIDIEISYHPIIGDEEETKAVFIPYQTEIIFIEKFLHLEGCTNCLNKLIPPACILAGTSDESVYRDQLEKLIRKGYVIFSGGKYYLAD